MGTLKEVWTHNRTYRVKCGYFHRDFYPFLTGRVTFVIYYNTCRITVHGCCYKMERTLLDREG